MSTNHTNHANKDSLRRFAPRSIQGRFALVIGAFVWFVWFVDNLSFSSVSSR
jgi:hypothetical protein